MQAGLLVAASRDGGQVVDLFKEPLLQGVIAQLLRQGKEAVRVLDEMAADDLWGLAFDLCGPVVEGHRAGRFRRRLLDFLPAQVRAVAGLLDELPVALGPLFGHVPNLPNRPGGDSIGIELNPEYAQMAATAVGSK